jgi:hypothetical protein
VRKRKRNRRGAVNNITTSKVKEKKKKKKKIGNWKYGNGIPPITPICTQCRSLAVCPATMLKQYMHKEEVIYRWHRQSDRDFSFFFTGTFPTNRIHLETELSSPWRKRKKLNNQKRMDRNLIFSSSSPVVCEKTIRKDGRLWGKGRENEK